MGRKRNNQGVLKAFHLLLEDSSNAEPMPLLLKSCFQYHAKLKIGTYAAVLAMVLLFIYAAHIFGMA